MKGRTRTYATGTCLMIASFVFLAALVQPGHGATLYRWVDASGQVHFSDQKHAGASVYDPRQINDAASASTAPAPAVPAKSVKSTSAAECDTMRKRLASYEKASSITAIDPLGRSQLYTKEQKEQLVSITRHKLESACGSAPAGPGAPEAASSTAP